MNRKIRWGASLLVFIIFTGVLISLLMREPGSVIFDLRDGSRLEILEISFSTNHVAHFGTIPQKLLFKLAGGRLSRKWVGHPMVIPAQDSIDGNLGIFVRHHVGPGDQDPNAFHYYKISSAVRPRKEHGMFLSAGDGEYGLWELNYWTENAPDFVVENSKGEVVIHFQIIKEAGMQGKKAKFGVRRDAD